MGADGDRRFFDNEGRVVEVSADVSARRHRKVEAREPVPVRLSQRGTANEMDEFIAAKSHNDVDPGLFTAPPM
ncbi:hypothetical protein [Streptomyces noursei]|uniref:hypothetical protein n=1 Tax=Streptomyces noursei TaxID=1971 RepID=UPI00382B4F23